MNPLIFKPLFFGVALSFFIYQVNEVNAGLLGGLNNKDCDENQKANKEEGGKGNNDVLQKVNGPLNGLTNQNSNKGGGEKNDGLNNEDATKDLNNDDKTKAWVDEFCKNIKTNNNDGLRNMCNSLPLDKMNDKQIDQLIDFLKHCLNGAGGHHNDVLENLLRKLNLDGQSKDGKLNLSDEQRQILQDCLDRLLKYKATKGYQDQKQDDQGGNNNQPSNQDQKQDDQGNQDQKQDDQGGNNNQPSNQDQKQGDQGTPDSVGGLLGENNNQPSTQEQVQGTQKQVQGNQEQVQGENNNQPNEPC